MIEELTAEKLKEYGFEENIKSKKIQEQLMTKGIQNPLINRILKGKKYELNSIFNTGEYYVSNIEKKIYSGEDRFKKTGIAMAFPIENQLLIPDYFRQNLEVNLKYLRKTNLISFNQQDAIEDFKQNEITRASGSIEDKKYAGMSGTLKKKEQYVYYKQWLIKINNSDYLHLDGSDIAGEQNKTASHFFEEFKHVFNSEKEYSQAVKMIDLYFVTANARPIDKKIFIKNGNIKNIAFVLGEIWRGHFNKVITLEYLKYCKSIFTIFETQKINTSEVKGINLYKYMISKT